MEEKSINSWSYRFLSYGLVFGAYFLIRKANQIDLANTTREKILKAKFQDAVATPFISFILQYIILDESLAFSITASICVAIFFSLRFLWHMVKFNNGTHPLYKL